MYKLNRVCQIAVSFIPALLGILAFINNVSQYQTTLTKIIIPMLSMRNVLDFSSQSWRAISNPSLMPYFSGLIMAAELAVGVLAGVGIINMLCNLNHTNAHFQLAKQWVLLACILGILTWGIGFFIIGGEYFLSWQNKDSPPLMGFQLSAFMYVIMMAVPYFILKINIE
jgi:predicted small integral membrane protein